MKKRIFVSWIGHTDLTLMKNSSKADVAGLVTTRIPEWILRSETAPINAALDKENWDEVHLLSNYGAELDTAYKNWVKHAVTIHAFDVPDPYDFNRVFEVTVAALEKIASQKAKADIEIFVNLSSGTHAMVATLLLLGTTRYDAKCLVSHHGQVNLVKLPFELDLIVREQFEKPDLAWARATMGTIPAEKNFNAIIGDCAQIRKAVILASRVAIRNVNVLLLGESGVGKELFAEAIHKASGRKGKFVAINCAAIPSELFESELFGAIKGAGTGVAARDGYFKEADGGTLFLDEVGELMPQHQSKLLRAIQSTDATGSPTKLKLQTVGTSGKQYEVDVRIVAATNRNLLSSSTQYGFRNDLYYRLATFPILIPPLRERGSDVVAIAKHLLNRINDQFSTTEPGFLRKQLADAARRRLRSYHWPGNVRELNAVITRAVIMATGERLEYTDIDQAIAEMAADDSANPFSRIRGPSFELDSRLDLMQKAFIEDAMDEVDGNQSKAAELLGVNYQTLNKRVHKLKIKAI